jgi:2'-5' RNA ligase
MRAFLALSLPAEVRSTLAALQRRLQGEWPVRTSWARADQLHLTLRFLGEIEPSSARRLADVLGPPLAALAPFSLTISGLGAFPSPSRPSVIWAGVAPCPELLHLQLTINNIFDKFGFPSEEKPFSPHLTLGRLRDRVRVPEGGRILSRHHDAVVGVFPVHAVILFQSRLTSEGAIHTELNRFPLQG